MINTFGDICTNFEIRSHYHFASIHGKGNYVACAKVVIIHYDQVMADFEHTLDILLSGQELQERKIIKHNFMNEHGQQDYYASTFSLFLDPAPLSSFEPASL